MNKEWNDINLPVNPWENKKRRRDEDAEKKAAQEQGKADAQAEADAYNEKFNPELTNPAWAHGDEARAKESPDKAVMGDTILLTVKTKGIVPGAGIDCFIRDQSVDAPWKTERKLRGRVADDDTVSIEWEIDKNENDAESPDLTFWFEDKDVNKPAKSPEAKIALADKTTVNFIEFPDMLYHKGCALPLFDGEGALVAALTAVFVAAKKDSSSTIVACGHAAKDDGGVYPALDVSAARAKAIKALLADDGGAWSDIAQDFSCAKDIQQFLAAAASQPGWGCDPGEVDGKIGPATKAAIKNYRSAFNRKLKGSLSDSDAPDAEFFGSMVSTIRARVLESYTSASGESSLPDLTWEGSCNGVYGCGTSFPPEKGVSEIGRRTEVYVIPPDAKPVFTEHTDDKTQVTTGECSLYGSLYEREPVETEPAEGAPDGAIAVDFVMVGSPHFNHNCALPCLGEKGELIGALAAAFTFAKDNSDRELIIEGHADTSGDPEYNLAISKRRAEAIKALLSNEISWWNTVVTCTDHKIEPEDYQATLKSLAVNFGWPCDPGEVDNQDGPKTQEGVKGFQGEYNKRFGKDLKPDGVVGPKTWEAIGLVIQSILQDHLKTGLKLDPIPALAYGYPEGDGIYPCGESFPVENPDDPDCKSPENRRVELVFYKKDDPTPAIAPSAGREIGTKKDPVSEKEWKKTGIKLTPIPPKEEKFTLKLFYPKTTPHTQYVNLNQNDEDQGPELKIVVDVKGAWDGRIIVFEATSGNNNSKRNDPKTGLKNAAGKIIEFAAKKSKVEIKTKDGKAECILSCGLAGGDVFTVEVTIDGQKETVEISNWRKMWYQKTYHKDSVIPSMTTSETNLKDVFIEFGLDQEVKHTTGSAGSVIIGNHNQTTYHALLNTTHTDQCVNEIFCDKQFDGLDSSGKNIKIKKTAQFTLNPDFIDVSADGKSPRRVFDPPLQTGATFFLSGSWSNPLTKKKGSLTGDPAKTNDNVGLVKYYDDSWVQVDLPKNATPDVASPVDVTIEVTAASGPWGGDGSSPPHNLIVIDADNTIHSHCVMHELGHLMNMVPISGGKYSCPPGFNYSDHTHAYTGMGGSGSHCSYKIDVSLSTADRNVDGRCIMFHQLNKNCELKFCPECDSFVKAQSLKKLGAS
jgi:outer membrane protein OmpA-like peptidoglycan-associated protein